MKPSIPFVVVLESDEITIFFICNLYNTANKNKIVILSNYKTVIHGFSIWNKLWGIVEYKKNKKGKQRKDRNGESLQIMMIIISLKSFPEIWVDYYREISSCLCSCSSCFIVFLPNFPSHFYILSNLVYLPDFGSSSWPYSVIVDPYLWKQLKNND